MLNSFRAELIVIHKRTATWVLIALPSLLGLFFGHVLPYASYLNKAPGARNPADLTKLLPQQSFPNVLGGVPFYVGVLSLILGALLAGSEFGWGTLKTSLIQRPSRLRLLAAKLAVIALDLVLVTLLLFAVSIVASSIIAAREHVATSWPAAGEILRALGSAWLILALWGTFGVLLAILTCGTAMAIGLGILYALVIEGVVSGFASSVPGLHQVSEAFLRTNGYSLVAPLTTAASVGGPGAFSGPFVAPLQALAVIVAYLALFTGASVLLLDRRDVT
jgi:ABC-2 type transport system permease protein